MSRYHGLEPVTLALCVQRFTTAYDGGYRATPSLYSRLPDHVGICLRGGNLHRRHLRQRGGRSRVRARRRRARSRAPVV